MNKLTTTLEVFSTGIFYELNKEQLLKYIAETRDNRNANDKLTDLLVSPDVDKTLP